MKRSYQNYLKGFRGLTLLETVFAMVIVGMGTGAIYIGSLSLQKSFRASRHYAATNAAQLRVLDSVALDLRRAYAVKKGDKEIVMLIPDYFDRTDPQQPKARYPRIEKGRVVYGDSKGVKIRYYLVSRGDIGGRQVNDLFREEAGVSKLLVSGIEGFEPTYEDNDPKKQIVKTTVSFPPIFRSSSTSSQAVRDATATHTATMVRNKREDSALQ